jgi:elongation factor 4
MIYTHPKTGE